MRSFGVKTEPKLLFTRITRHYVTRAWKIGLPRFKMQRLAFYDLKGNEGNFHFEFGVDPSLNEKLYGFVFEVQK